MEEALKQILEEMKSFRQEVNNRFERIDKNFDKMGKRFDRIEADLEDVKRVVRMSAEDILENQVEEAARHNLHEDKIHSLEATTFRIDKSVLDLKRRVEKLEKTNQ